MRSIWTGIFISLFCLCLCGAAYAAQDKTAKNADCVPACPDYSKEISWASRPAHPDKKVDVFYVYPTIYPDAYPKNMDVFNQELRADVQGLLKAQAGVFSNSANLFAPYYRQVSFTCLDPTEDTMLNSYFRIGADDIHRAFDYYLNFLNQGRPFILASHSQGSVVMLDLLRSRFKDPKLQKQLVAAYVIGYSVTGKDLQQYPWLKPAQKADDTGVIISWNTQAPGATGSPVLRPGAICINPLNWRTDETPADKDQNMGAVFFDDFRGKVLREVPHYTGAQIDRKNGVLVTTPPEKLEIGHFPQGVLHKFDFAFWYRNLQKNVKDRIDAYFR
ncbi:DUF3089 domain-containing protein [Dethiosulfatarculus sandiegensis]|uniref:DNA repair and recombination protein RadA n=1 Tax=Dethiosulfatarculus sandiegensis TaxID=1429043 RepID=A0A0D2J3H1_9BACT|nr:DUF3089 domain-containing protein [Dethiosulfatarculus sandiegensis]KIX12749.1 DNA repair and recombination protein RadA [Dethiosulfatarculus sandiegensis]